MTSYLVSALLMGTLVLVVVGAIARSRHWYSYAPGTVAARHQEASDGGHAGASVLDRTETWITGFVLLALGAVVGVFAFVSDPAASGSLTSGPVVVGAALFVALYVLLGVYATARQGGHSDAIAAAETAAVGGVLLLLAIALQLLST